MKVLFYGRLAEMIAPELEIDDVPGCSIEQLRERLIAACPAADKKQASACLRGGFNRPR